jgi:hypothetical protein
MIILALDLSKRSTGFAVWSEEWEKPHYGHWCLGGEFTSDGAVFLKLQRNLNDLHRLAVFDWIYHEEAINPANLNGVTNIGTLRLAAGLSAAVEMFAEARRCNVRGINLNSWRPSYIDPDLINQVNADVRRKRKAGGKASARPELKRLAIERSRQLGFAPKNDDEAEALGVLDYACSLKGIVPPWRAGEVLRPPLGAAA